MNQIRCSGIVHFAFALALCLVGGAVHSQTPAHSWSQRFGDAASQRAYSVATDGSGNIIVVGDFAGSINLGGGDLICQGGQDMFVAKFDPAGVHLWSQRFGDSSLYGLQYATAVATDESGNIVVTGYYSGTVNFGGGNLNGGSYRDVFVVKFNSAGVHQWSQRFGAWLDTNSAYGTSVAIDPSGNVIVAGEFEGDIDIASTTLTSNGGLDLFVAKLDAAGAYQWSQRFGDASNQWVPLVATDGAGNIAVTGHFGGTVDFGGGNLTSAGSNDIYLAKFSPAGVHQWSQRFGDAADQRGQYVATDGSGNVIITGWGGGTIDFGGGGLVGGVYFLAKFNSAGVHQWSQKFGTGLVTSSCVDTDADGNVIFAGHISGTIDFGGGLLTTVAADALLAKFNPAGEHVWSQCFGDSLYQSARSVATDGSGNAVVTGYFERTIDFGGGDLTSAGDTDVFVAKFNGVASEPLITSILDIGNDQGRGVRIEFSRSGHDEAGGPVTQYEAYRRNDALAAPAPAVPGGTPTHAQLLDQGWVYAGDVPAHGVDVYLMDAPTDADSTIALGQHYSAFFIRAATDDPLTYYDCPVDSGYSLDNLAPGVPGGFAYGAGLLSWNESTAEDFDYFSVYGANTNSFATATLVDYCATPAMDVTTSPYVFYFVTATDFSGNEGKPAVVNTLTGTSGSPKSYVLSIVAFPNPFNPTTTIRYTVPSKGRVVVEIYDARGSHVATLVSGERDAGAYTQEWTGRDDSGRAVSSGVYFARVSHASGMRSYKLVLLK
jgi:hypothetical protein